MQDAALIVMIVAMIASLAAAIAADAFRGRVRNASGKVKPATWIAGLTALVAIGAAVVALTG